MTVLLGWGIAWSSQRQCLERNGVLSVKPVENRSDIRDIKTTNITWIYIGIK